jgi:hypothetical protein
VRIFNANASSIAGELPIESSLPQIWVENPDDAGRAREIIDTYLKTSTAGNPTRCELCGEENPPAFEVCWSCGAGLEAQFKA